MAVTPFVFLLTCSIAYPVLFCEDVAGFFFHGSDRALDLAQDHLGYVGGGLPQPGNGLQGVEPGNKFKVVVRDVLVGIEAQPFQDRICHGIGYVRLEDGVQLLLVCEGAAIHLPAQGFQIVPGVVHDGVHDRAEQNRYRVCGVP
jgi:hypothetical protein